MERRILKLWYDPEGDYMEVLFEKEAGHSRETENERVMEKVGADGGVLGFSVPKISSLEGKPIEVALARRPGTVPGRPDAEQKEALPEGSCGEPACAVGL